MSLIDLPALKEITWHKMRGDLKSLVPYFADNDLLLCPACCRPLSYDEFSVEHIVPRQALALDPPEARANVTQNERAGITLLCRRPLVYKGRRYPGQGCNSWKGKHYDPFLKELIQSNLGSKPLSSRHQVALSSAGYLGLFRKFGYQIALSPAGVLMRNQFFNPNAFLRAFPLNCQIMLGGERLTEFKVEDRSYWSEPFKITINEQTALIGFRSIAFRLPLSRDPRQRFAQILPYAPLKHRFRPDLTTAFEM